MKGLIACEKSGIVREAFKNKGHNVMSCDLQETDIPGYHYKGDVRDLINEQYDFVIAFPYCTHTSVSGSRWFKEKMIDRRQWEAIKFFLTFVSWRSQYIAIEHPISIMSTYYRKPDQIIQPWLFGHGENKKTCLWLKNLPNLIPTKIVDGRENKVHEMWPSAERSNLRSKTYEGVAQAMADQWLK